MAGTTLGNGHLRSSAAALYHELIRAPVLLGGRSGPGRLDRSRWGALIWEAMSK